MRRITIINITEFKTLKNYEYKQKGAEKYMPLLSII